MFKKREMNTDEIILYQPNHLPTQIEVQIKDESVWLNRQQLALLFDRDIKTIGKHIGNAIKEELNDIAVVAKFATTASDGKIYKVEHYNLDMVLSIGYRVKSARGVEFRIWANGVLKEFLLKGYAVHNRIETLENKMNLLEIKNNEFDLILKTNLPLSQGIFYDGQVFDAHAFVSGIMKSAKETITLFDNYVDETVLVQLAKKEKAVKVFIYTKNKTKQLELDIKRFNEQYGNLELISFDKSHDRFLIIDKTEMYHLGASLKDLGKKWFAFSKLNIDPEELLGKL